MVFIVPFIGAAALLSGFASALPRPQDSAIGDEVAVSAPNGIPITDSAELASQIGAQTQSAPEAQVTTSSSGYGSSGSYGSSDSSSGYGSNSGYGADSSNQWTSSSSSWAAAATSTSVAYSSPSYGSGSSNWGGSGYDDCVSQCIASFGAPAASYAPTATSGSSGSYGSGATHTVIVAPTQGVFRYVPFAVNASIGDTIKFMWGADNHTVTKSSSLAPCNKSADALFTSGSQNKDFVFTQVVNDTNPTFFHCGTPGHCQKGMFGIINPPNAIAAPTSVSGMMSSLSANNSDISAYATHVTQVTANDSKAAKWGGNIDMASLPEWSHSYVAENVLYTRSFLASNSEVMKDDGSIDLSAAGSTPLMIPQDIGAALNNAGAPAPATPSPATPSAPASESPAPSGESENQSNGASSLASPQLLVGFFAIAATLFAL